MELPVPVETISKDKVSVKVEVTIQYQVLEARAEQAFYRLSNPEGQIKSYVFDQVRAEVPEIELDDVFTNKEQIAGAVKEQLASAMDDFGYQIINVQVTDVDPDAKVKASMNASVSPPRSVVKPTRSSRSRRPKPKPRARSSRVRASPTKGKPSSTVCANRSPSSRTPSTVLPPPTS